MSTRTLLFEIGTEELPPTSLPGLGAALTEKLVEGLAAAGIPHGRVRGFATPRRLSVVVERCALQAPDRDVERRGPPLANSYDANGEPLPAARAFARSCGVEVGALSRLATDKGTWLRFRGTEAGAATKTSLGGIVNQAVAGLPIAKRMRWGERSTEFVRPVHWIVLLLGEEIVDCEVLGLRTGRITFGHRFHAPGPRTLRSANGYEPGLRRARVIADFGRRRETIRAGVVALGERFGGRALIDTELLDEVTALVEWPVPIAGQFEQRFLSLPREVIIATVQDHQRYFAVEEADGSLSRWFITVSNIESRDPARIREGNERVVRPRLSDAAFFWEQDRKLRLEEHAAKLGGVTFQAKLGSYADKTRRVQALSIAIGRAIGAGPLVERAARLAKADLMSAIVGEFPELQGTMGRYYAAAQGEPEELCLALEEQYRPRHAGDSLPLTKTGQALALADKIDTLIGIFAIDQKPTGTKDPFGLRRAALGVLRILLDCRIDLNLFDMLELSAAAQPVRRDAVAIEVQAFISERLRGLLLERADGTTTEMIDAVLAAAPRSPLDVEARLQALKAFLQLPEAAVLAAANKRIANILKKAAHGAETAVDVAHFTEDAERSLHLALDELRGPVAQAMRLGDYAESLRLLAALRPRIDAFFEKVLVMDENQQRRDNRLALLRDVLTLFGSVADLSRLPG